jgi:drug/metabolite transporter (DMT)-like permease
MVGFSYAYSDLPTATGALILFASVQFTVIGAGYCNGERLSWRGLFGLALAGGAIAWLLLPGAGRPGIASLLMMASAGIAWGFYTMIGRGSSDATGQTARSFFIAALLSWPFWAIAPGAPSGTGVALAIAAGVVTSAFGYALWYRVAPRLGLALVSSSQLATPIVAAVAANILLDEILSWRTLVAGALVLGGIALTVSPAVQTHALRSEPRS